MLNIANIQHFSLHDGDGIRTTIFFKGCNLKCPWCHNPETISCTPTQMNYPKLGKTEICGKNMTVSEVFKEVMDDKDYYVESGGGVTFSGGEVMLYADKVVELAKLIKGEGISLFCDTAGCVRYEEFEKLNPFVDTYLFDFKTGSEEKYKEVCGGDLTLVKENICRLIKDGKKVRVRIPLIPDFNIDSKSIDDICKILLSINVSTVDLLPFHRLGSGKYEAIGIEYKYKDTLPIDKSELENIKEQYSKYFKVKVEI